MLTACSVTPTVWQPYPKKLDYDTAKTGWKKGNLAPDFKFKTVDSNEKRLSDYEGKIVFLHFWGSWCKPCRREIPQIESLYKQIDNPDIEFILLNMNEEFETSMAWMKKRGFDLPIFNSMSGGQSDKTPMTDVSGNRIPYALEYVPKTFVIDRNGLIVFRQDGSKTNWTSYVEVIKNVITESEHQYP